MRNVRFLMWLAFALLLVWLDRLSKHWVLTHLLWQTPDPVFPGLQWFLTFNSGAAFGFLHHHGTLSVWPNVLFVSIALIFSFFLIKMLKQTKKNQHTLSLGISFLLGGAWGNVWDRFQYGYVIDFIDIYYKTFHWYVFNVADIAITLGVFFLCLGWLRR